MNRGSAGLTQAGRIEYTMPAEERGKIKKTQGLGMAEKE